MFSQYRSSRLHILYKIDVFKNFTRFLGKIRAEVFLIAYLQPSSLIQTKKDSSIGVFTFFIEHSQTTASACRTTYSHVNNVKPQKM